MSTCIALYVYRPQLIHYYHVDKVLSREFRKLHYSSTRRDRTQAARCNCPTDRPWWHHISGVRKKCGKTTRTLRLRRRRRKTDAAGREIGKGRPPVDEPGYGRSGVVCELLNGPASRLYRTHIDCVRSTRTVHNRLLLYSCLFVRERTCLRRVPWQKAVTMASAGVYTP